MAVVSLRVELELRRELVEHLAAGPRAKSSNPNEEAGRGPANITWCVCDLQNSIPCGLFGFRKMTWWPQRFLRNDW